MKSLLTQFKQSDGDGLIAHDPYLEPYIHNLRQRHLHTLLSLHKLEKAYGSLEEAGMGHTYFGFSKSANRSLVYREWAPGAISMSLTGDCTGWDRTKLPLKRDAFGVFSIEIEPSSPYYPKELSRVKTQVSTPSSQLDRLPAYSLWVEREGDALSTKVWTSRSYAFSNPRPKPTPPLIYETHIGMAQEKEGIGTFAEFESNVLPRIKKAGYNAIQIMALQSHPYYGSFGYQVSNFFAISDYFGTPVQLKHLIDVAHGMGIRVFLDLVHSHSVKNLQEGLNQFDGTDHHYFLPGEKGYHSAWDTRLFDYGKLEVQRFLLSNIVYFLEEFQIDGFRFDGVTSMLYHHHGLGTEFNHMDRYFDQGVNLDAISYLQLATTLARLTYKDVTLIAEDVSGFPGMCRPVFEGGLGFDYRLHMGIPDMWISTLKHDNWNTDRIFHTLTNTRPGESHIAYVESHDQAMVGDKTTAFWLMDQDMYSHMSKDTPNLRVDVGIGLHKLMRMVTLFCGGEGYLTFMGNEFGHPEWIDFPREGNGFSYHFARRQWSLVDNDSLKYHLLADFDRALVEYVKSEHFLSSPKAQLLYSDVDRKLLAVRRGNFWMMANFHANESYSGFVIPTHLDHQLKVDLCSDDPSFGGQGRVDATIIHTPFSSDGTTSVKVYLPTITGMIGKFHTTD